MIELTREQAHAKIDEVYDELEKISLAKKDPLVIERLLLQGQDDDGVAGCILCRDTGFDNNYISWGLSPYGAGLHSGHYDMSRSGASCDWETRTKRGW